MAQNPLGSYGDDDADLPDTPASQPAAQPQPRNDLGQFLSPAAPVAPPAAVPYGQQPVAGQPQQPAAPQHNPYMVAKARQFGIDPAAMTPDVLASVLTAVETQQAAAASRAAPATPPAPAKAEEPAVDWGEDDEGKPITTEEQARKVYPKAIFNAIKASHQVEKLAKTNAELQQRLEQQARDQHTARVEAKLNQVLATRPDLFGADPAAIVPNSAEWHRRNAVIGHLNGLVAQKAQTTIENDVAGAIGSIWPGAPAGKPGPAKPQSPDLAAAYRQAELARTTGRVGSTPVTRRELMIEVERQKLEANGSHVVAGGGGDDDDDLPAPKV